MVSGVLTFPHSVVMHGAKAVIRLFAEAPADARAELLQEHAFDIQSGEADAIPFAFELGRGLFATSRLHVGAEVRMGHHAALQRGDWVSTQFVGILAGDLERKPQNILLHKVL